MSDEETSGGVELNIYSPLYARYNGSMLGFFLAGSFVQDAAERYPVLRERMHEFLRELGITLELPGEHKDFVEGHDQISMQVLRAVSDKSSEVIEFALLSSLAMYYAILREGEGPEVEDMRAQALRLMEEHELPRSLLSEFARGVRRRKDGSLSLYKLHTASLSFLREVIEPLSPEPETAFVAMPFAEGTRENFPTLYAPALREAGYRAIRAWGGLANEDYQEMLLTLISKCGVMLAELTELNQNVLYEVGYAHGVGVANVMLIAERGKGLPPSNISHLAIFQYGREGENWREEVTRQLVLFIAITNYAIELEEGKKKKKRRGWKRKAE